MSKIPAIFTMASWRCTTPVDTDVQRMGVGFNLKNGDVIRLNISVDSAKKLAESIQEFLINVQSLKLSEISSVELSIPSGSE